MAPKPLKSKAAEPGEDMRSRIISAARRLLGRDGLDATSIKEIATEAGVAAGLIHYYFKSKDALLVEVVRTAAEQYRGRLHALRQSMSGPELGRAAFGEAAQHSLEDPAWFRLRYELFALGLRKPELRADVAALLADGRGCVSDVIRQAADVEGFEPSGMAALFLCIFDGLGLQKLLDPSFDLDGAYQVLGEMTDAYRAAKEPA